MRVQTMQRRIESGRAGGIVAADFAASLQFSAGGNFSADSIYAQAAGLLGLYGIAFYGERATPRQRRALRDAWRASRLYAQRLVYP